MKLLQLNVTANWGSTGKIAEGIGKAAIARGWDSTIAYGRYMNPSQSNLIKVGNQLDVYAHYAKSRLFDGEGLGSKSATRKLISHIKELNPDIIHLHNIHDHWLNYPILFEYLASITTPIVWTFHDCWPFTGGCTHFENVGCLKWKDKTCNACPLGHRAANKNIVNRFEYFSKVGKRIQIITVSEWLYRYVRESPFSDVGASIRTINNGIEINNVFQPGNEKVKMVLGVSNVWSELKGLNDFYKLRTNLPSDINITLVGLTKKQIATLPKGISGIRRTSNGEQLAELYRKSSVFLNPTYNDSFPTVNLEALACGTPVVTYRTGGSPEAVDDKTGIVVEKGDVKGMTEAVMHILKYPELYTSENCRKRAEENFNQDIQFNKYIDLYENLLNN